MRVLILGRTEWLHAVAEAIAATPDHQVCGILTAPAAPEYEKDEADFATLAERLGVPFACVRRLGRSARELIAVAQADVAVSLNWVSVISAETIRTFRYGILNGHSGQIPRYRGNAVTNWHILRDEPTLTFSAHAMRGGELDTGEVYGEILLALGSDTTIAQINEELTRRLPGLFVEALGRLERGAPLRGYAAPESGFRCFPRLPRDGRLRWDLPARKLHALVRSLAPPYAGAHTYYRDAGGAAQKLFVLESRLVAERTEDVGCPGHVIRNDPDTGESWVLCGDGVLALRACRHEGGPSFAPGAEWRSIRMRLGLDIEEELFRLLLAREAGS